MRRTGAIRRRMTAWSGLAAMAAHVAALALGAVMPVAMAQAGAAALPGEIVICTVHGPMRVAAATLDLADASQPGPEPGPEPGDPAPAAPVPCGLAQHAAAAALDTAHAPAAAPVGYAAFVAPARPDAPCCRSPVATRTAPPRAPPVLS